MMFVIIHHDQKNYAIVVSGKQISFHLIRMIIDYMIDDVCDFNNDQKNYTIVVSGKLIPI